MTSVADKHQGFVDSCCLIDNNFAGQSTDMCSSSMTCKENVRDKKHLEHLRDKNSFSGSEKTTDFSPDLTSEVVLESDVPK
ncbi:hypothetical protein DPMN_139955 [Dreissena polymorpha]|uniref:Uncharacterized protein n=1 Tax=Dreissena polymorpha TaxID=45954 RepID=A0A9D4GAK4_DREPO|nr:hypothetical protein DPMN_139955 [Dreissena polymorpha]